MIRILASLILIRAAALSAEAPRQLMQADYDRTAESAWLKKKVFESRLLDDMASPSTWSFSGQGSIEFPSRPSAEGFRFLRVKVAIHDQKPGPGGYATLPAVTIKRAFPGEDWSRFNRLSFWVRPQLSGFPVFSLDAVFRNDGKVKVPDVYRREGTHYMTMAGGRWTHVVWEIGPLARDKVTSIDFHYWVNKRLPDATDSITFEIGKLELQRVEPDHQEGWDVAPGRIAFSHTGYQTDSPKTAIAGGLSAPEFIVRRARDGGIVLRKPICAVKTRLGQFQELDFSELRVPGSYTIEAGAARTRPFPIGPFVWAPTIWKTLNFFYGERCGMAIPGIHDVCHQDWRAVLGDSSIVMNGGWHDAGDLSQGLVNTGESVYAMFALAERLQNEKKEPALLARLIEEARWGLDWVLKVRFDGGFRIGFASMNIWTNGIIGDADDRTRVALNNPNVNYIAAAAEAVAYRVLRNSDPELASRSLQMAEDDWRCAIDGKEIPETQSTPAFAATEMELASVGILASLELYQSTGRELYVRKARELARIVTRSQQKAFAGTDFPLAGFFYTGPDRKTIFHQFHRGNDQAPIVALARLCEALPNDPDWIDWYATVALFSEYQKRAATTTEPYGVLPAYVYRDDEWLNAVDNDRYQSSREAYRRQVLRGMPMGGGYHLKAFPVWFGRRGNYGVLLSQAKALSAAARLRRDRAATELAQKQLQWVVGRNPFTQSSMWGEGYDFAQQYSVSSGDLAGSLPVGMMSRGDDDVPYWPNSNSYVYKEVWVHPSARWLWLMQDLAGPALEQRRSLEFSINQETSTAGTVTIWLRAQGSGAHTFSIRAENLVADQQERKLTLRQGEPGVLVWKGSVRSPESPWVAVVIPDGDVTGSRDLVGSVPRRQ